MAYYVWSAAVPLSLYVTRGIGSTVREGLLRREAPQALDTSIDTAGALSSAAVALTFVLPVHIISPTLTHLRALVQSGKTDLEAVLRDCALRQHRRSLSRLFRQPCYREENLRLRALTDTLKSRVQLYITMLPLFASNETHAETRGEPHAETLAEFDAENVVPGIMQEAGAKLAQVFSRVVLTQFPDSSDSEDDETESN
jgi:hypothetical protein